MAYTINLTNGTELVAGGLSDGAIDTSATSLVLIGKNYAGYGEYLNENLVHMLEHFAAGSGPANPLRGQLWWDTTNNILRVYSGTSWKISTGATSAPFSAPPGDLSALGGDLWFDSTNQQLKIWSGAGWVTVGPVSTPLTGDTGAFPSIMTDTSGGSHIVTQIKIVGVPYVIISKDTFSSALAGFSTIKAGVNFSTIASPALQISTQDATATPLTLVQRDSSGAIFATGITGTIITASSVTADSVTGSFAGPLAGNVTAPIVSATTVSAAGVSASSGYTGTLLTASQPNVTGLGTLTALNVNGDVAITATSATLNGSQIATLDDPALFTSINNTPIGNATPSTGAFTTLTATNSTLTNLTTTGTVNISAGMVASTIQAGTIGNSGATLTGTLSTAIQPNVTSAIALNSVGNITTGTWSANVVSGRYGGTGVNNAGSSLTIVGNLTLNQNVASNASPTLRGTNFNSIPNDALINTGITFAGTFIPLGGSYSAAAVVGSISGTTNQVIASSATGDVVLSLPQSVHTGASIQFGSLGVGTGASGTTGEIRATNNVVAYYSDDRLKTRLGKIENALDKLCSLEGFYYEANETAQALGYKPKREVGLSAQKTQEIMPEITAPAPIDEQYLTIMYERFAPLIVEAIKELRAEVNVLKAKIK